MYGPYDSYIPYLRGAPFVLGTAHHSLTFLVRTKFPGDNSRVAQWFHYLHECNVQYMPGKRNRVADALSCIPRQKQESGSPTRAAAVHHIVEYLPIRHNIVRASNSDNYTGSLLARLAKCVRVKQFSEHDDLI